MYCSCCRSRSRFKRSKTCGRGCRRHGLTARTTMIRSLTCTSSCEMPSSSTPSAHHRRSAHSATFFFSFTRHFHAGAPQMQKLRSIVLRIWATKSSLSLNSGVGQSIAVYASPTARNLLIEFLPCFFIQLHTFSIFCSSVK